MDMSVDLEWKNCHMLKGLSDAKESTLLLLERDPKGQSLLILTPCPPVLTSTLSLTKQLKGLF